MFGAYPVSLPVLLELGGLALTATLVADSIPVAEGEVVGAALSWICHGTTPICLSRRFSRASSFFRALIAARSSFVLP